VQLKLSPKEVCRVKLFKIVHSPIERMIQKVWFSELDVVLGIVW